MNDPVDKIIVTECHLEWADGREFWSEEPEAIARAVYYRRRVRGGQGLPYAVTCWREGPGSSNTVLWEMEWTADDLRPTATEVRNLLAQGVPPAFVYALFPNRETLALLHEFSEVRNPGLPDLPMRGNRKVRRKSTRRCATPVQ